MRHPSRIPIEVEPVDGAAHACCPGRDVGYGGLCFEHPTGFAPGTLVRVRISSLRPVFECRACVSWCRPLGDSNGVGVFFLDPEDARRARMVEQVCHIKSYRRRVREEEGRYLTDADAAREWIDAHAADFGEG